MSARRYHHVLRLDVAVQHAVLVRFGQRLGNLFRVPYDRGLSKAVPIEEASQRLSLDVFHDDEVDAVFLTDVEDGADVGVAERGERAGLALEAASGLRIRQQLGTSGFSAQRDGRAACLAPRKLLPSRRCRSWRRSHTARGGGRGRAAWKGKSEIICARRRAPMVSRNSLLFGSGRNAPVRSTRPVQASREQTRRRHTVQSD